MTANGAGRLIGIGNCGEAASNRIALNRDEFKRETVEHNRRQDKAEWARAAPNAETRRVVVEVDGVEPCLAIADAHHLVQKIV